MNKRWIAVVGLTVVVASLVFAGLAFAQTQTPPTPGSGAGYGWGRGMMSGQVYTGTMPMGPGMMRGGRGMMRGGGMMGAGPLHDYMLDAFAAELDLPRAELDERLAGGETMFEIALAQGLSRDEFFQAMQAAREAALEQAVADGALTQEQADWMRSHGHMGRGQGSGLCPGFAPTEPAPASTTS